ncbi:MAG: ATP-binding cassette domain-containing protein [Lachnospiraceae bacterium]|nr:ATP-binding cassette domain-containing protein [Lachnospiraceae bacterium]
MIRFEHVEKRYEESGMPVFHDFSESVRQGEFILLTGESGAGKSTLLRLLLKETPLTGGRILVAGQDISRIGARELPFYRRKIGVVFQETLLVSGKNVYENVELARLVAGAGRKENRMVIASLLKLLGIGHLHLSYPEQLSGGERQKVCLARALANYPSLLLADEPTGNLSPSESKEIMGLFELIHRQGITVIVATHDRASAEGLLYREIALKKGEGYGKDGGSEASGQ